MATVRFAWDANTEPDVNGYKLYAGRSSGVYTANGSPKVMGNVTTGTFDTDADGRWFFALTATDTEGLESGFSAEISAWFIQPPSGALVATGATPTRARGTPLVPATGGLIVIGVAGGRSLGTVLRTRSALRGA